MKITPHQNVFTTEEPFHHFRLGKESLEKKSLKNKKKTLIPGRI